MREGNDFALYMCVAVYPLANFLGYQTGYVVDGVCNLNLNFHWYLVWVD